MLKSFKQHLTEVLVATIKAELSLFQVQQKGMLRHTSKLMEPTFDEASAQLGAVEVGRAVAVVAVAAHIH